MTSAEPFQPKIGLCMIVKDESHVIKRCLDSVKALIDFVMIEDTGSTDGTQQLIQQWLTENNMPGRVYDQPWQDFAHNRSSVLAALRECAQIDYALIMDADDVLQIPDPVKVRQEIAATRKEAYRVPLQGKGVSYHRTQIVSNHHVFFYVGVLHEYIEGPKDHSTHTLNNLIIQSNREGARSLDPDKYKKDAQVLDLALQTEKDPFLRARYMFYLAQSHKDAGDKNKALQAYLARSVMGFWKQETYIALLNAGRLMLDLDYPIEEISKVLRQATPYAPNRLEAHHALCRALRLRKRHQEAFQLGNDLLHMPKPTEGLFIEAWVYQYALKDEVSICAYWCGQHERSLELCTELLNNPDLPANQRERVRQNGQFALQKLNQKALQFQKAANPVQSSHRMKARGGTELMVEGLFSRLQYDADRIHIAINQFNPEVAQGKKRLVWVHHDFNQAAVQWMTDREKTAQVDAFVFVSDWQKARFIHHYGLDAERCKVLRNATSMLQVPAKTGFGKPVRLVYASTPFRGLDLLLEAWQGIQARYKEMVELHVFSSMKLYGAADDKYQELINRAKAMPGCVYHGIVPNQQLKEFMLDCDVLAYPSTFEETSCLAAIDALSCGLRVIAPDFGALRETCEPFGRIYSMPADRAAHIEEFSRQVCKELDKPWGGHPGQRDQQIQWCREHYDWEKRVREWENFLQQC